MVWWSTYHRQIPVQSCRKRTNEDLQLVNFHLYRYGVDRNPCWFSGIVDRPLSTFVAQTCWNVARCLVVFLYVRLPKTQNVKQLLNESCFQSKPEEFVWLRPTASVQSRWTKKMCRSVRRSGAWSGIPNSVTLTPTGFPARAVVFWTCPNLDSI